MNWRRRLSVAWLCLAITGRAAGAQTTDDWRVAIYPVLGWVPLGIGIDVEVPPGGDVPNGGAGEIIDGRFDGAFFGGISASKGRFRIDADGVWAAVGGDRIEVPRFTVDADLVYWHGMVGVMVAQDWYLAGGVRRMALKYDITFGNLPTFERDPGVWDPLIGIGWHRNGDRVDWHVTFEGGGFGVGADVDLSTTVRFDWRPFSHFGLTAGYNFLYFKVTDAVRERPFTVKQTLHGPLLGIGLYF